MFRGTVGATEENNGGGRQENLLEGTIPLGFGEAEELRMLEKRHNKSNGTWGHGS